MPLLRRAILYTVICLLAGAVINVGIALTAFFVASSHEGPRSTFKWNTVWPQGTPDTWPACKDAFIWTSWGITEVHAYSQEPVHSGRIIAAGWPRRSFQRVDLISPVPDGPSASDSEFRLVTQLWLLPYDFPPLAPWPPPVQPVWSGFIVNIVSFGGIAAIGLLGSCAVRRTLRARRGGCASCGYSQSALPLEATCPECGK